MIQTDHVVYSIDNANILEGISLHVPKGALVGILGPNGSGKSTLLKCIYRVLKPTSGAIFLDGTELSHISPKEAAQKLAVVAQHNFSNFDFTVEEVVLMGRSPYKKALERNTQRDTAIVRESLERVGMENFSKRSFLTLSGGEQQRVILARALAQQTPCLVLDEPTNHLDIKYQLQLMDLIHALDQTVFMALHDLNIAAMYCDKLYVVKKGQLVGEGSPKSLLTPSFIREVYEIDADVMETSTGQLHVLYHPAH
ncbi:MAG: ABC transporter ATP-binding protein [Lachnospiraceae bacterium]|nr:ABC transporter ATP-binding protein [Lachnospiraceae bacterium]